ncbi:hypothetical protein NDU88_005163 [Pleurodeles waltl]|uniref:Uncharacterized protein n=1 Tax=Pleurodeles waltl TaxID=8319 RepID=A0AAV7QHI5_PLEWA|nr:hypothetical protein NDU88_005163 [Pleurodeles waltl]
MAGKGPRSVCTTSNPYGGQRHLIDATPLKAAVVVTRLCTTPATCCVRKPPKAALQPLLRSFCCNGLCACYIPHTLWTLGVSFLQPLAALAEDLRTTGLKHCQSHLLSTHRSIG